jgi:FkbM family methyltransferase
VKRAVDSTGLGRPARWLWQRRPGTRAHRQFAAWLAEASRRDDERTRLVMACTLDERSNCIDIGAATGDVLAEMVRLAPHGHHIAYEALPVLYTALRERFPDVDARNVAVSDQAGDTTFAHVRNAPGWSGLQPYEDIGVEHPDIESVTVRTVRLDDDLPVDYVPALIKIDVNGAEAQTLGGG